MGKWSYLKDKLPPLPDSNPKHSDLVERAVTRRRGKKQSLGLNLVDYKNYRDLKDRMKIELSAAQIEIDALEKIIREDFEAQGIHKMTLDSGETVSVSPEPYAKVEDNEKMVAWAKSVGLEKSLSLAWQTLNSHLKQRLENGQSEMPGVVPYLRWTISFRRN